jgi:hypothetical protein
MTLSPEKTFFDKTAVASNLLTVPEFRKFARALGLTSWRGGARRYAALKGGALVVLASGDLLVFSRKAGKIVTRTYPQKKWGWA